MPGSVIVAGARTPIGKLSGALAGFTAMDLGGFAIAAALERAGLSGDQVDYVIMGQVILAGAGQITARQAAVKGGIPLSVPATTVNKVCLSGLNAIYLADQMINAGDADIVVAGGMESMTGAPHLLPGARAGLPAGRRHPGRLDDVRRPHLRLRRVRHGAGHRALQPGGRHQPRAPGRLRRRLPREGGQRHQGGPAGRGDRGGDGPPAQGRPGRGRHRRGRPARHHRRVAGGAQAGLRQGGHHHRRQRLADLRRRRGGGGHVAGQGRRPRPHPAGRARRLRPGGRPGHLAAHPALAGHRQGPRHAPAGASATSTSSRSTRPSPPSAWPRPTTWASTRRTST